MKNQVTALAIVTAALLASSAFGQQNDQRNRNSDRQQNQPSRQGPSNDHRNQPNPGRTTYTGTTNRVVFLPNRGNNPQQPRNDFGSRQNPPVSQEPRNQSWTRTRPNYDPPRNDYRPAQRPDNSWNRNQPSTNDHQPPTQAPARNWGSESWSPAPARTHGVEFGQNQMNPSPQTHQTAPRPNQGQYRHVVVPTMPQPKPTVGADWNFGRNPSLASRNYASDAASHPLEVRQVAHITQRPNWGGHWREGYSGWQGVSAAPGFRAFGFSCSFYLFTPFYEACNVSPFYYYSCLPPYIPADQCQVVRNYSCSWDTGNVYRSGDGSYSDENLDNAIANLQEAFNQQDFGAISSMMPASARVGIFTDGAYDYSLDGQDFEAMMADTVTNTDTLSFDITGVRWFDGGAIIQARHEVQDPDGTDEVVYQRYRLRYEDGNLVITDFSTSH